ncbi:MAG: hypothetical protein LBG76_10610 [Treponema sp.]|jgi:hypothetical protein|nr:hypothetical protein [Treponema sp.]
MDVRLNRMALWGLLSWVCVTVTPAAEPASGFSLGILWAGSWEHELMKKGSPASIGSPASVGSLVNRGELRLSALGFQGRALAIDKRPLMPWDHPDAGNTAAAAGLYHNATGSRLLWGILDEGGLSARLSNPWSKPVPQVETRRLSMADLKTSPSSTREPEAYLYLGSPRLGIFRGFASAQIGRGQSSAASILPLALGGGLDVQVGKKIKLGIEGFFTEKRLSSHVPSAWFSQKPPLPERDFTLYGLNLFFSSTQFAFSADGAYSETFAFGRDLYGSLALRLGSRPWQFSLGADAAGSRFTGRNGASPGAAFRTAARVEWKGRRSSRFQGILNFQAPGLGEAFERGSLALSFRFPRSPGFSPEKISLDAGRNAEDRKRTLDSAGIALGINTGPVKTTINAAITGVAGDPWPGEGYNFDGAKVSAEASVSPGAFLFRVKTGCTFSGKEPVWDASIYGALRFKYGRLSVKLASPTFPQTWLYTISWLCESPRVTLPFPL